MFEDLIRFFGFKGSWKWAVRQMIKGSIVRPSRATGSVKYRLSHDGQLRFEWTFDSIVTKRIENFEWKTAYIFLRDLDSTDWVIYRP